MWKKIIEKMYDPKDYEVLMKRFQDIIEERKSRQKMYGGASNSKYLSGGDAISAQMLASAKQRMTREELALVMQSKDSSSRLSYSDFQKTILDFQLQEHEKFLYRFT